MKITKNSIVYDYKGKSIVRRIHKPKKENSLYGKESVLIDIIRENGKKAINMPISQFSLNPII